MKSTDKPSLIETVIASGANASYVRTIPKTQTKSGSGEMSLALGWPPECAIPVAAGGKYPQMADANGVLNLLSAAVQQLQARFFGAYNADFATAIGGYPLNAIVSDTTAGKFWVSTAEDNTTAPGSDGASWQSLFTGLQPSLGFTPVQQGGGFDQVASKVYLGRDSTFPGLRYSYVNASDNIVTGGYLVSSYGPEPGGPGASFEQIGDISIGADTRLHYRGVALNAAYYTGALLDDVQGVQANVTAEATARTNADTNLQNQINNRVQKTGDTMSGPLSIDGPSPGVYINSGSNNNNNSDYNDAVIDFALTKRFGYAGVIGLREHVGQALEIILSVFNGSSWYEFDLIALGENQGRMVSPAGVSALTSDLPLPVGQKIFTFTATVTNTQDISLPQAMSSVLFVTAQGGTDGRGTGMTTINSWTNSTVNVTVASYHTGAPQSATITQTFLVVAIP